MGSMMSWEEVGWITDTHVQDLLNGTYSRNARGSVDDCIDPIQGEGTVCDVGDINNLQLIAEAKQPLFDLSDFDTASGTIKHMFNLQIVKVKT